MADRIRERVVRLAKRVRREGDLSSYEEIRLELAVKEAERPTPDTVKRSIASVLNESIDRVNVRLAEHSDSERIIDEIISELESGAGDG